jgi:hypothetical protein
MNLPATLLPRRRQQVKPEEFLAVECEMADGTRLPTHIERVTTDIAGRITKVSVEARVIAYPVTGTAVASHLTFLGQTTRKPIMPPSSVKAGSLTVLQDFEFSFTPFTNWHQFPELIA